MASTMSLVGQISNLQGVNDRRKPFPSSLSLCISLSSLSLLPVCLLRKLRILGNDAFKWETKYIDISIFWDVGFFCVVGFS